MFKNFFKTSIRNLWKNKTYSFLNIFGLAVGIACAGLIFLWVEDEVNFDGFNKKKDHLYFVRVNAPLDSRVFTHGSTPGILAPAMQTEIPGIENTCRMSEGDNSTLFSIQGKPVYASGKYAELSVFSMFTLPFVQGNAKNAFAQLYSLVITEKTAKKFFGNAADVLGRTVRMDNKQDYVITGVLKDIPQNSSVSFEWVAPFQIWFQQSPWASKWENNCLSTYVELKPGASEENINKQLYNFVQKKAPTSIGHVFLSGMNSWHLYSDFENGKPTGGGFITYVRLFTVIAWIILLIACINFMNLATARSERRAREVGVRKVLGAGRTGLIAQFMGEAFLMAALATVSALVMMTLLLPSFNLLVKKELVLGLDNRAHVFALLAIAVICGIIAGSYPSFYLSAFNPVFVLKGIRLRIGSAAMIRKGLVVLQFSVSIILIIATVIIFQQIDHVRNRNLGFNKDNLIELSMHGDLARNYEAVRQELLSTGNIESVALADHATIYGGNNTDAITWSGKSPGKILISWRTVSPDYFATSKMKLLEGRNFESTDTINFDKPGIRGSAIITESLAKLMGKGTAIGKMLYDEQDTLQRLTVVGVVNDYVYGDMYGKPDPVIFASTSPRFENTMYLRIRPSANPDKALASVESVMKKYNPAYPFDYRFVDDQMNEMFSGERLVSKLSGVFATLAILISCLGLFGLAAYTAEKRIKEIGIRKVLGASVTSISALLTTDFIKLVVIASGIAFPVAWWVMHEWLKGYQYRIEISVWIFLAAGLLAIVIAVITISFQAIKAALMNPARSLKTE